MSRKLLVVFAALVAFTALPAIASAAPVLTENGVAFKANAGVTILGTADPTAPNITFTTNLGTITCTKATITGDVLTNDNVNGFVVEVTKAVFHGDDPVEEKCTSTISDLAGGTVTATAEMVGTHCLRSVNGGTDNISIKRGTCAASVNGAKFLLKTTSHTGTNLGTCEYERQKAGGGAAEELKGTFNTNVTPATGEFSAGQTFRKIGGTGIVCPTEGTAAGKFIFETDVSPFTGITIS